MRTFKVELLSYLGARALGLTIPLVSNLGEWGVGNRGKGERGRGKGGVLDCFRK
jgi:hypothetical protein